MQTIKLRADQLVAEDHPIAEINDFCTRKRSAIGSKCREHYLLMSRHWNGDNSAQTHECPYGLLTSGPIGGVSSPEFIYAINITTKANGISEQAIQSIPSLATTVIDSLEFTKSIINSVKRDELTHFEAAVHDVRHLNQSIIQNSEQLLYENGFKMGEEWDIFEINRNPSLRRIFTIFCASRSLSQALEMHEISRDPSSVLAASPSPYKIHREFYRTLRISSERLESKHLTYRIGNTTKSISLKGPFSIIPNILIDNAIKYSQPKNNISVEFIDTLQSFKFLVKNRGPIPQSKELQFLFDRGKRGSNKKGISGSGLGLWIAKQIVQANSGKIEFETREEDRDLSGQLHGEAIVSVTLFA